jgi:hypothetical protein
MLWSVPWAWVSELRLKIYFVRNTFFNMVGELMVLILLGFYSFPATAKNTLKKSINIRYVPNVII